MNERVGDGLGRTNDRIGSPRLKASGRRDNVGKGSRQIGSVTSGKGLALKVGPGGSGGRPSRGSGSGDPRFGGGLKGRGSRRSHVGGGVPSPPGGGAPAPGRLTTGLELIRTRRIRLFN